MKMINLFDKTVKHIPKKHISRHDCMYLGYVDSYCVWLVVEEWEFRIYNYEEWREEDLRDHEWEDWWGCVWDFFGDSVSYLDIDTIEYSLPTFEEMSPLGIASELLLACDDLEDVSYTISDGWVPTDAFLDFIRHWIDEIKLFKNWKVYLYYK